jgi:hypothetical protein
MKIKHPKFKFLNDNSNPTLEEVMQESVQHNLHKISEDTTADGFFFLEEFLTLNKEPLDVLQLECTPETFAINVLLKTITCCQGGGLAVGVLGNYPQLACYLPKAATQIGHTELGTAIQKVIDVFPKLTNFLHKDALYCDILNFMENPNRKITRPLLQGISEEEKQNYHQKYMQALEVAELLIEKQWYYPVKNEYQKLKEYYQVHKEKLVFKTKITEQEYQVLENKIWQGFLEDATPEELFQSVVTSNWDSNEFLLNWIKNNPKMDKATMLAAYWMSGPRYLKQFKDREDCLEKESWSIEAFDFIEDIEEKYLNGFYSGQTIAYDPKEEGWTDEYLGIKTLRSIPEAMFQMLDGKSIFIDYNAYTEGLSNTCYEKNRGII